MVREGGEVPGISQVPNMRSFTYTSHKKKSKKKYKYIYSRTSTHALQPANNKQQT